MGSNKSQSLQSIKSPSHSDASAFRSILRPDKLIAKKVSKQARLNKYLLQEIEDHSTGVNCLALSEDLSLLVSGGEDGLLRLWSTFSSPCECIGTLCGHKDYITCCIVYRYLVISGSADCTLKVWRIDDGQCLMTLEGHEAFINRCCIFGSILLSSSFDNTVRVWTLSDQLTIIKNDDNGNVANLVSRIKMQTSFGQCLYVLKGHTKSVTQVVIVNNDQNQMLQRDVIQELDMVVTTSTDGTARIYNLATGELRHVLLGHDGAINCLAIDPKETRFVYTAGADSFIKNWNIITGEFIRDLNGHEGSILCMISHNRILYSGSVDRTVRAWAMEFGQCTRVYYQNTAPVNCLQYFKGILYTGCNDYGARLYDSNSAALKQTFTGHCSPISALQVVPGKLFTSSFDGRIMVWDCSHVQTKPMDKTNTNIVQNTLEILDENELAEDKIEMTKKTDYQSRPYRSTECSIVHNKKQSARNEANRLETIFISEYNNQSNTNYDDDDGCLPFLYYFFCCCWSRICCKNSAKKSLLQANDKHDKENHKLVKKIFWAYYQNDNSKLEDKYKDKEKREPINQNMDSLNVQRAVQALEPYLRSFQ